MQTNELNQTEPGPRIPAPVKEYVPETMTYQNLFTKWFLETLNDYEYFIAQQIQKKFDEFVSLRRTPYDLEKPISMETMKSFQKYLARWGAGCEVFDMLDRAIKLETTDKKKDKILNPSGERYTENGIYCNWYIPIQEFDLIDLLPKDHTRYQIRTARALMEWFPIWIREQKITLSHMDRNMTSIFLLFASHYAKEDVDTFTDEFIKRYSPARK